MRIVRLADCPVQRWRNGGGNTRELASHSEDGDVIWRISVATIAADGPFSRFDGMDRSLVPLGGGVLTLTVDGHVRVANGEIAAFPGEASVIASIRKAPVQVINIMTRRKTATHYVTIGNLPPAPRRAQHFAILLAPSSWQDKQLATGDLLAHVTSSDLPDGVSFAIATIISSSKS